MKHIFILVLGLILGTANAEAQDVYNLVLGSATRIINNPTSIFTNVQIAQFKRTALTYMKSKALEISDTIPSALLDTQAYYMSEFITLFIDDIVKSKRLSDDKRKQRILMFTDASISNPLFNDPDKDTTMSFMTDGNELTPFSLDTDWHKAYAAAISQLRK